jgi:hypothetical protein
MPFSAVEERTFTAVVPYNVVDLPRLAASYSRIRVPLGGRQERRHGGSGSQSGHPS